MKRRNQILVVVGVLAGITLAVVFLYMRITDEFENAYAVWNVADLVIDYMDTHGGKWPGNWNNLAAMCTLQQPGSNVRVLIEHYQKLVDVDFTANPTELARHPFTPGQKDPPFRVIRFRRRPDAYINEPNVMIWEYLHGERPSLVRATTMPIGITILASQRLVLTDLTVEASPNAKDTRLSPYSAKNFK